MQNNNDAGTSQQKLKNVVNKIRQMSEYNVSGQSHCDDYTHECTSYGVSGICLEKPEIQTLMSADTQTLCQALIDTQPFWSWDNPYVKYSLIASECLVGTACCAGGPLLANAGLIGGKAATGIATCGIIPCYNAVGRAKAKSDNISDYLEADLKADISLLGYGCKQAHWIGIIVKLSRYRIHTEDDKKKLMEILEVLTKLRQKPEPSQNNNYSRNIEDINNKNKICLNNGRDGFQSKKN